MVSTARETLNRARRSADRAAEAEQARDRTAFAEHLENAISLGRNVTFHLQAEYKHHSGFNEWWRIQQDSMRNDPLAVFFKQARNVVVKRGPVDIHAVGRVSVSDTVHVTASVDIKVIWDNPWYRRQPRILWNDLRRSTGQAFRQWRQRWQRRAKRVRVRVSDDAPEAASTSYRFYFDDPAWRDDPHPPLESLSERPALNLLRDYFAPLEAVVADCEARFGTAS